MFFFSSRRRHTRLQGDWSSDVCSSDLAQVRPDQGYSRKILAPSGALLAEVAEGNRKDIRNAVEAAHAADGWAKTSGHNRGQVLYYLAENLEIGRASCRERV